VGGKIDAGARRAAPFVEALAIQKIIWGLHAVQDVQFAVLFAAAENIVDQSDHRSAAEAAGYDYHVASARLVNRPSVSVRPSHSDHIPHLPAPHHPGHAPDDSDGVLEGFRLGGIGNN